MANLSSSASLDVQKQSFLYSWDSKWPPCDKGLFWQRNWTPAYHMMTNTHAHMWPSLPSFLASSQCCSLLMRGACGAVGQIPSSSVNQCSCLLHSWRYGFGYQKLFHFATVLWMWSLYEIIHICTAVVDENEEWSWQQIFQFKQLEWRSLKKNQGFNAIRTRDLRDTGAMLQFAAMITLHFHLQPQYKYELFHINFTSFHCTGRYELNKLTSLPMCGISLHGKIWTQKIDLVPNVWLHSSVGRASHWYHGGHRLESRWSPDFFSGSVLHSNCLNWKIFAAMVTLPFQFYEYSDVCCMYKALSTVLLRNLKSALLLWKRIKCFPSTLRRRNLKRSKL